LHLSDSLSWISTQDWTWCIKNAMDFELSITKVGIKPCILTAKTSIHSGQMAKAKKSRSAVICFRVPTSTNPDKFY
jgi:hypothetical protein